MVPLRILALLLLLEVGFGESFSKTSFSRSISFNMVFSFHFRSFLLLNTFLPFTTLTFSPHDMSKKYEMWRGMFGQV